MSWIDLRARKPTAEDADTDGKVFVRVSNGEIKIIFWSLVRPDDVAWMPIPEFTPLPDPPEGYQILTDYDAAWHQKTMYWVRGFGEWRYPPPHNRRCYEKSEIYAVPRKPPEPQYRPFANAEEFRPFRERWWKHKDGKTLQPTTHYSDALHHGVAWKDRFQHLEFEDGTPFGIKIN